MEILIVLAALGFGLLIYLFLCYMFYLIAVKTGTPDTWMAWIPILQIVLMLKVGGKPIWWIVLFFVPIANIIVQILMWMSVAEARGKPNWIGILVLVPCGALFVPAYLAFSE